MQIASQLFDCKLICRLNGKLQKKRKSRCRYTETQGRSVEGYRYLGRGAHHHRQDHDVVSLLGRQQEPPRLPRGNCVISLPSPPSFGSDLVSGSSSVALCGGDPLSAPAITDTRSTDITRGDSVPYSLPTND
ncbi:hypothetical protein J6590_058101 [Homalodisca vitripennis]|nr:hypothetical protein J6590_058101 [Homalodisca vitripennis]